MTYVRYCDNPPPSGDGKECEGEDVKEEKCFLKHANGTEILCARK